MALYAGITLPGRPDLENVRKLDLLVLPQINRMSRYGIAVDLPYLKDLSLEIGREMVDLQKQIDSYIPADALDRFSTVAAEIEEEQGSATINANSAEQIRELLFDLLKVGASQPKLKLTSAGKVSTGKKQLEMCRDDHPVVPLVLQYRERAKLKSAFCDSLPLKAKYHPRGSCCPVCELSHVEPTWRLHTTFTTTRTETGRLACVAHWTPVRVLQRGVRRRVPISSIDIGDYVWTHKRRYRRVTAIWRKGIAPMYNVTFSNGHTLTCTGDHVLLMSSHERIEAVDERPKEYSGSSEAVSYYGSADYEPNSGETGNDVPQYPICLPDSYPESGVRCPSSDPILSDESRHTQPDVREDRRATPQLDRTSGRWVRVFDLLEGWKAPVCTPDRDGGSFRSEGDTRDLRRTPYQRRQKGQQTGQSCFSYSGRSSEDSLPTGERHAVCYVEKIEAAGSFEVFDISVDEDESYEACGVFNHNSKNPNLQQIPQRSDLGARIRAAFLASPGTRLVSVDFGQIELRDLAHLANAMSMINVYRRKGDIHIYTACQCFGRDEARMTDLLRRKDLTPEETAEVHHFKLFERLPSKNLNFMTVYGATPKGLQAQLALSQVYWSEEECRAFQEDRWFGVYPEVKDYMRVQEYRARRYGFVWDPWGRVRRCPEIYSSLSWIRSAGIRQAGNMPIQACSAGQTKLVMAECEEEFERWLSCGVWCWPLLSIHDQVIAEVEEDYAVEIGDAMSRIFSNVMVDKQTGVNLWRVPIESEPEILSRWEKS